MSAVSFVSAFVITFVTTPILARYLFKKGITGVDLHKEGEVKIPEMGGLAIFFSILVVLLYHFINGADELLFPLLTIYIIGTLGIIDGFTKLSAIQKILSFTLVGTFLAWGLGHKSALSFIFLGLLFMAAVNFTNMLAGFNGLEIGTGAIASAALALISYLSGQTTGLIISAAMAGALLAFLYYNRYPASVFPGDVGTLIIGAALFSTILINKTYLPGLIVFTPYIIDATLKYRSAGVMTRESQKPTILKQGKLYVPETSNLSLPRLFLRKKAMTEKQVVTRIWIIQAVFAVIAVTVEVAL